MRTGVLLIIAAAACSSLKAILTKLLYAEGLDALTVVGLRAAISLPFFWIVAIAILGPAQALRVEPRALCAAVMVGVICYYLGAYADFVALTMIDASLERIVLYSFPAMVVLIETVRTRRLPPLRQWIALILTYIGVIMVMGGLDAGLLLVNLVGVGLVLLAALSFAIYAIVNQTVSPLIGSVRFTLYAQTAAAVGLITHFVVAAPADALDISGTGWALLVVIATVCAVLPFFMLSEGIRRIGASRSALLTTVGPPLTFIMAFFVLGERMSVDQLAGAAVILLAILALEGRLPRFVQPRAGAA